MKRYSKNLGFIAFAVKAITGIAGSALVLTENHPYITLLVLMAGALSIEAIDYFGLKKRIEDEEG